VRRRESIAAVFQFRILGPLEVQADGDLLAIPANKQRALLALLLLNANEVVARDRLIDSLWPEAPPASAANAVQVHVSQLRKTFARAGFDAKALLVTQPPGYLLRLDPEQVDARRFERLVREAATARGRGTYAEAAASLDEALSLWRGPALADLAYEEFAQPEIVRLEELRLSAVEDRLACDIELGRHGEAIGQLEALVTVHPLREGLRALLMLGLYRSGRQADALQVYRDARSTLRDELGIEPGHELRDLEQAILRQDASIAPSRLPGPTALPLPSFLASFVGRERELDAVVALLGEEDVRLLTLTGLGGIGKTRLAVAAAQRLEGRFADGTAYVALATISEPELVPATIAQTLLPGESGPSPDEVLASYLQKRRLLLVLDNFEQVLPSAPLLSNLLAAAPGLKVLVTSRARLQLSGEREYPVPTLPAGDAVALFAERAHAVDPRFVVSQANADAVVELCTRLEGLPLAIELAAARTKLLPPAAMLGRLGSRLDLLAASSRDAPQRHHALRTTLDWSYDLLTPAQQRLFARLGVFVGGWSLEAAEVVCSQDAHPLLDDLSTVVDESLVYHETTTARFAMLETVREYALERLRALSEEEDARRRHAAYFLELAETARASEQQAAWLAELELEHDNLRAAQAFARERGDGEMSLRFCVALWRFWQLHGHLDEGRRLLTSALDASPDADPRLRAKALNGAGVLAGEQGDFEAAATFFEPALAIARELDDHQRIASVLTNLGNLALFSGDFDRARSLYEESLSHGAAAGDVGIEMIARENLGLVALDRGNLDEAVRRLEETAALAARRGDERALSSSARALAAALIERGDSERAREPLAEALMLARRLGERNGLAYCFDTVGGLAIADGDPEGAAVMFGAADELRASIGALRPPDQQPLYERWLARTLAQLDISVYAARYEDGRSLDPDQACELALRRADSGVPL
jgi:predicted ATPase/DNA-binding SARP family transcriptional activator